MDSFLNESVKSSCSVVKHMVFARLPGCLEVRRVFL